MQHHAATHFWHQYLALPREIRARADQRFSLLKADPRHPSLQFKKVGERRGQEIWSARITLSYRALAIKREDGYLWFWIGDHKTYDRLISRNSCQKPQPSTSLRARFLAKNARNGASGPTYDVC